MIALLYIPVSIAFAWLNARWIKQGKHIYHFWNGLLHILVAIGVGIVTKWEFSLAVLFIARVFFDWALNLMRGLPLGYVSPKPKSIVDRLEKWIFKLDGVTPKIIYLLIIVVLMFI